MTAKGEAGTRVLDSITANAEWIDRLMELFWAVDAIAKIEGGIFHIPVEILEAYEAVERARREL